MERSESIVSFIECQLEHRKKTLKNYSNFLSTESLLDEFGIINCSGFRQVGATTAILDMFNTKTDIYIGHNTQTIIDFKSKLKDLGKDVSILKSVSFNNINHSNIFIDERVKEKLNKYLDKLTVLHIVDGGIKNLETSRLKDDVYKIIDINPKEYIEATKSLRGKSLAEGSEPCRVFIDLGSMYQQKYAVRIKKFIEEIYTFNTPSKDQKINIVFILT